MNFLWKTIRTLMAIVGVILIFGAVGTSDYYVLELGQAEPPSVLSTILIGVLMTFPLLGELVYKYMKGESTDVHR